MSNVNDVSSLPESASYILNECAREPIHIPGAIQPHGALLAVLQESGVISLASANLHEFLALQASAAIGQPLAAVIGAAACRDLLEPTLDLVGDRIHVGAMPGGEPLHLRAHRSGRQLCIDIERIGQQSTRDVPVFNITSVLKTFRRAASSAQLCDLAVRGLKAIAGYDRVMAYRFGEAGDGEVIAEVCKSGLEPYIGLRYPASDIPAQARRMYQTQRVGAIADSAYVPVPLLTTSVWPDDSSIDLTHSSLRSVSPVHREYMRNMGTAASLTVGLVSNGQLWGMLVCHHGSARIATPALRASAEIIGEVVSLLLASLAEAEVSAQQLSRYEMQRRLVESLARAVPLRQAMLESTRDLLGIVNATGAIIRLGGSSFCIGRTPTFALAEQALSLLMGARSQEGLLAIDDLGSRFSGLSGCTIDASGALLLPLDTGLDDAIVWFRPELSRNVAWGGNPNLHASADPVSGRISPRRSFASWQVTVRGQSEAWSLADLALAKELCIAIGAESARRVRTALRESEARFQLLAEHSGVVVTLNDLDGNYSYVSPAVERVLGWRPEQLAGRAALELVHPDDRNALQNARAALLDGTIKRSDCYRAKCADGTWIWVEDHARLRHDLGGLSTIDCVVVLREATDRKTAEIEIATLLHDMGKMASTDSLTALANRRHFDEVSEAEFRRCKRERLPLSLLLLDVDHFKLFNDCYGHLAGDDCLRSIAQQLLSITHRAGDLAARYGGEEFVILLPNTDAAGAMGVAEQVRKLIEGMRIEHLGNLPPSVVTVSIGVATAMQGEGAADLAVDIPRLLQQADAALYRAKSNGRNQVLGHIGLPP